MVEANEADERDDQQPKNVAVEEKFGSGIDGKKKKDVGKGERPEEYPRVASRRQWPAVESTTGCVWRERSNETIRPREAAQRDYGKKPTRSGTCRKTGKPHLHKSESPHTHRTGLPQSPTVGSRKELSRHGYGHVRPLTTYALRSNTAVMAMTLGRLLRICRKEERRKGKQQKWNVQEDTNKVDRRHLPDKESC